MRLKELYINRIDDNMMTEISTELTLIKRTNEITSEQVLSCAKRVVAQSNLKKLFKMQPKNTRHVA